MDYPGCFAGTHPIHEHLAKLEAGQFVSLHQNHSKIEIRDSAGRCVGRLSEAGRGKWQNRLGSILEARILAVLRRDQNDPDANFIHKINAKEWELPLVEIVCSPDRI